MADNRRIRSANLWIKLIAPGVQWKLWKQYLNSQSFCKAKCDLTIQAVFCPYTVRTISASYLGVMYHHLPTVGPSQCCCWEVTARAVEEAIQVNKGDGRTRDRHTVYTQGIPRGHMDDVTTSITAYQEQRGHVSQSSIAQIKCTAEECLVTSMHKITYIHYTQTHKSISESIFRDMCTHVVCAYVPFPAAIPVTKLLSSKSNFHCHLVSLNPWPLISDLSIG